MSRLLSRWQQPNAEGRTQSVTPESAGWGYVGFEAYELQEGEVQNVRGNKAEDGPGGGLGICRLCG